jgi:RNA polymerase sigma-70 factor (ECF subfamily)
MRWQSTFRTWSFSVARHACYRMIRDAKVRRTVPLSGCHDLDNAVATVRSATATYLQTAVKDGFARLREALTPDEQSLLTLRIDRDLEWNEIAQILADQALDAAAVKRAAASCRKRFERLTEKLRALAKDEGMLGDAHG